MAHYNVGGSELDPSHIGVRTAAAAVVGGTSSTLGGGKFANGAMTAAFDHLFNAEATQAAKFKTLVIVQEGLSVQNSWVDGSSKYTIRDRWRNAASDINEALGAPDSPLVKTAIYSSEEDLRAVIVDSAKSYDYIVVVSHGNGTQFVTWEDLKTGEFGHTSQVEFKDSFPDAIARKLDFYHCLDGGAGKTDWAQDINRLRGKYGLASVKQWDR